MLLFSLCSDICLQTACKYKHVFSYILAWFVIKRAINTGRGRLKLCAQMGFTYAPNYDLAGVGEKTCIQNILYYLLLTKITKQSKWRNSRTFERLCCLWFCSVVLLIFLSSLFYSISLNCYVSFPKVCLLLPSLWMSKQHNWCYYLYI